jgi:hypothetical protein
MIVRYERVRERLQLPKPPRTSASSPVDSGIDDEREGFTADATETTLAMTDHEPLQLPKPPPTSASSPADPAVDNRRDSFTVGEAAAALTGLRLLPSIEAEMVIDHDHAQLSSPATFSLDADLDGRCEGMELSWNIEWDKFFDASTTPISQHA